MPEFGILYKKIRIKTGIIADFAKREAFNPVIAGKFKK
jgi:hypothetical protein